MDRDDEMEELGPEELGREETGLAALAGYEKGDGEGHDPQPVEKAYIWAMPQQATRH